LADAGKDTHADALCRQAAAVDGWTVSAVIKIVDGLVEGREPAVAEAFRRLSVKASIRASAVPHKATVVPPPRW
jgi:hypothetical protein